MLIYERLKQDHREQEQLAEQLMDTSGDTAERRSIFSKLRTEMEAHAAAEEQTFYAALIAEPDGQEKARHSVAEHKEAADLLDELDELDMSSGGWIQKFKKLKNELSHHIEEEEREVFALARKLIDDERARSLAEEFVERKRAEAT